MTKARDRIISLADTQYYHCMARCVRRAYLFGSDSVTGERYDHRKAWVVEKLAQLSDVFAIDICAYAVMSNHYHVVLRVGVESAAEWTVDEVIDRWRVLFAGNVLVSRYRAGAVFSKAEHEKLIEIVEEWRSRLMSVSWFMRVLNESIARMANKEDDCKGRFWEGRFKCQALLDEAAVLACMAYVDLNPVRAGIAELPELSDFTSIQQRLAELMDRGVGRPRRDSSSSLGAKSQNILQRESVARVGSFMDADIGDRSKPCLYPFNKGFELREDERAIAFSLSDYAELIDWTGRAIREDKRGAIPEKAAPILARLGLSESGWLAYVPSVEKRFTYALGNREAMQGLAQRFELAWLHGQGASSGFYDSAHQSIKVKRDALLVS